MAKNFIFIGIFIFVAINGYAMDELEETYHAQLVNLVSKIRIHKATIKFDIDILNAHIKYGVIDSPMLPQYLKDEKEMQRLTQEYLDLRIEVLKKYGKLPDWWKEIEGKLTAP